jgi:hypothetical protein
VHHKNRNLDFEAVFDDYQGRFLLVVMDHRKGTTVEKFGKNLQDFFPFSFSTQKEAKKAW